MSTGVSTIGARQDKETYLVSRTSIDVGELSHEVIELPEIWRIEVILVYSLQQRLNFFRSGCRHCVYEM